MNMIDPKIEDLTAKLRDVLTEYSVDLAILFGSYVKGCASGMSDMDILVEGDFDEARLVMGISERLSLPAERVDLARAKQLPPKVLARVLNEGVTVLCRKPEVLARIAHSTAVEYPQVMELYRLSFKNAINPEVKLDTVRILDLLNSVVDRSKVLDGLLKGREVREFERDPVLDSSLRWLIYEIVQSMIDICAHLAVSLKMGVAESYGDYIVTLVKRNVMVEDLGLGLIDFVSLRNRLAHRYRYVTAGELVEGANRLLSGILPDFIDWVQRIIAEYGK